MRLAVLLVVVVRLAAGCYAPSITTGAPCDSDRNCPHGQLCDLTVHRCEESVGSDVDGGDDVVSACDPNELVIDGACAIPIAAETPASAVSAADCSAEDGNNARPIAIDRGNRIYVAFACGGANDAFIAVSSDGGKTAGSPVALNVAMVDRIALVGSSRKTAYAAIAGGQGVTFASTTDGGLSWTTKSLDTNRPDPGYGVAIATAGSSVYVAVKVNGGTVRVWRNAANGTGAFDSLDVMFDNAFGEVLANPANGDVWLVGDTPALHTKRSTDGAQSFGATIDPPGSYNFSDWALGGGGIFVTGTNIDRFSRISLADPAMASAVNASLPSATARGRAIAVGPDESVYIANQNGMNQTAMLRFAPGSATSTSRALTDARSPHFVVGPGTAMPYAYTDPAANHVKLGVFLY